MPLLNHCVFTQYFHIHSCFSCLSLQSDMSQPLQDCLKASCDIGQKDLLHQVHPFVQGNHIIWQPLHPTLHWGSAINKLAKSRLGGCIYVQVEVELHAHTEQGSQHYENKDTKGYVVHVNVAGWGTAGASPGLHAKTWEFKTNFKSPIPSPSSLF